MINIIVVILGIGLVILVHELGHFLAARYSGVRVEAFSIGFGPVLCKHRRGDTEYRLSLIPLGGYVKMAGEAVGEGKGREDELTSKPARHRFLIFSAGVIMNVIFAVIFFIIAFAVGVPFRAPVVGAVARGGPAWEAGLPEGAEILSINGRRVDSFSQITTNVALSEGPVRVRAALPGEGGTEEFVIHPRLDESRGFRMIRVEPALEEEITLQVDPGGPAARAGLESGDRLLALEGVPAAELDRRALTRLLVDQEPLELRVARSRGGEEQELRFTVTPEVAGEKGRRVIGVRPVQRRIEALRRGSALVDRLGLSRGDVILQVGGEPIHDQEDLARALAGKRGTVPFLVRRAGGSQEAVLRVELGPGEGETLAGHIALGPGGTRVVPIPGGSAAAAGVRPGERVVRVNGAEVHNWEQLRQAIAASPPQAGEAPGEGTAAAGAPANRVRLAVEREGKVVELDLEARPTGVADYGFLPQLSYRSKLLQAGSPLAAVKLGLTSSWDMLEQIYLSLSRVFSGSVAAKNLGGPIMIFQVSTKLLEQGIFKFLWFLAVISINLAFINILPIPVLDGGHLLFLLVEKVKGSPVSERVMIWAQMAGLAVVLGLILFVTYNDILRAFGLQ